ncbi:MAG TPA: hypothetical protein ENJ59_01625 [Thermofilum sp.]|nr:hypothetical protein [Thermofilum sp.]
MLTWKAGRRNEPWTVAVVYVAGALSDDLIMKTAEWSESRGVHIVVVDPGVCAGELHLRAAVEHAVRAFSEGRNISKYLEIEVQLYIIGKREIHRVLRICRPKNDKAVIIAVTRLGSEQLSRTLREYLGEFKLKELEPPWSNTQHALKVAKNLGISDREIKTVDEEIPSAVDKLVAARCVKLALST